MNGSEIVGGKMIRGGIEIRCCDLFVIYFMALFMALSCNLSCKILYLVWVSRKYFAYSMVVIS